MGVIAGANINDNGLVFSLDAANNRSYTGSGSTSFGLVGGIGGTLINGTGFSSANGGSFIFDGTDDYINSTFPVNNNSDFTIGFWMNYQDVTSPDRGLVSTWDISWNGFGIGTYNSQIRSWVNDGAGGGINWAPIVTNTWKYYTLAFSNSLKTQYVYIDGIFLNSETRNTTVTHSSLQIARGGQSGSTQLTYYPYLKCQISQLSIYNRALSAKEIKQNYNATKKRYGL
jgi:hypothetical protein